MDMKTLTQHNMRIQRIQKHNDRNFYSESDEHINNENSKYNLYWNCYDDNSMTFQEAEQQYYEEHYSDSLEIQNSKYRKKGQKDRIKTIEDMLVGNRTAPMETLLYIGNSYNVINPELLTEIVEDFMDWLEEEYGSNFHILDISLHVDEERKENGEVIKSAPHFHMRSIIDYIDDDGFCKIGQDKGLEALGIEPPNKDKPISRNNNRRQTFDAKNREKLIEICKEHDIEIIPSEGKSGQSLEEYKAQQDYIKKLQKEKEEAEKKAQQYKQQAQQYKQQVEAQKKLFNDLQEQVKSAYIELNDLYSKIDEAFRDLESVGWEYSEKSSKVELLQAEINRKRRTIEELDRKAQDFGQFFDMSYYDEQQKQKQQRSYNIETTR